MTLRQVCSNCHALLGTYHYEGCVHARSDRLSKVRVDQCYVEFVAASPQATAPGPTIPEIAALQSIAFPPATAPSDGKRRGELYGIKVEGRCTKCGGDTLRHAGARSESEAMAYCVAASCYPNHVQPISQPAATASGTGERRTGTPDREPRILKNEEVYDAARLVFPVMQQYGDDEAMDAYDDILRTACCFTVQEASRASPQDGGTPSSVTPDAVERALDLYERVCDEWADNDAMSSREIDRCALRHVLIDFLSRRAVSAEATPPDEEAIGKFVAEVWNAEGLGKCNPHYVVEKILRHFGRGAEATDADTRDSERLDFLERLGKHWSLPDFCEGGVFAGEWQGFGADDMGATVSGHTLRDAIDALMNARTVGSGQPDTHLNKGVK